MFQWIINIFQDIVALFSDSSRSNAERTDELLREAARKMSSNEESSDFFESSTSLMGRTDDMISQPLFNIDGTPMCGILDIHGNPYGITSSSSDGSFSSFSSGSDLFSSCSSSSDSFSSMGCSSDW